MTPAATLHWIFAGVLLLGGASVLRTEMHEHPRVVYNPSASVPLGWYLVRPADRGTPLQVDDIVLARLPDDAATLAAQRGYLPLGLPILKRIGAVAPQTVCVAGGVVRINGIAVASTRTRDGAGREMVSWGSCRALAVDEIFLLSNTHAASFDSRYFGPIRVASVLGIAQPLWTWSGP